MGRDRRVISSQQTGFNVEPTERVTLTQKPHFINACRYVRGKFSCALECLLEIWLRILSPLIPDTGTSKLIYLLKQTERAYNAIWWYMYMNLPLSVNTGYQLHLVREVVWSFVRENVIHLNSLKCSVPMFLVKVISRHQD